MKKRNNAPTSTAWIFRWGEQMTFDSGNLDPPFVDFDHWAISNFAATASLLGDDICKIAVPETPDPRLRLNIRAALGASKLGLKSVDYTRDRYLSDDLDDQENDELAQILKTALAHVNNSYALLTGAHEAHNDVGSIAAESCLVRLTTSFAASSLLFRFGMPIEARAIARLILEQASWAYAVKGLDSEQIDATDPRRCIGHLKGLMPHAARSYGVLSKVLHLTPPLDRFYVVVEKTDDGDCLAVRKRESRAFCTQSSVILIVLADIYAVVSEVILMNSIAEPCCIESLPGGRARVRSDRPFRQIVDDLTQRYWGRQITEC